MPRPHRCEFRGAIYLVTIKGYSGGSVFYKPLIFEQFPENPRRHAPDEECFENLLWETCEQYNALVHAYRIEPNGALIVIQTRGAPLHWVIHDVVMRFSMYLIEQARTPEEKKPFPRRYKAQVVQPTKLPYVVRYVQRREIDGHSRRRAINHPFSSSLIYGGRRPPPKCFVVDATREALENLGYLGPAAFLEFMARLDSPSIAHLLSLQVIGEPTFADFARSRCGEPQQLTSPDEILREVTRKLLHAEPDVACSSTHRGALARALVAWYAMRTGTAQVTTVSKWFGVTSSGLRYLIRQHRRKTPQYFSEPLSELFPMLSDNTVPPTRARAPRWPGTLGSRALSSRAKSVP